MLPYLEEDWKTPQLLHDVERRVHRPHRGLAAHIKAVTARGFDGDVASDPPEKAIREGPIDEDAIALKRADEDVLDLHARSSAT